MTKLTILGEFPTLNQIIKAAKSHPMAYANQKKDFTALGMIYTKGKAKIEGLNDYTFVWYRKNRRSDPDNISAGVKYVLDSLVKGNVLENDGWNQVNSITHKFKVDKDKPRVEIFISKVEG